MTKYIGGYRFWQSKIAYQRKEEDIIEELAYSFHLGSDKNKKRTTRLNAKKNKSGTTSLSNNAIQNAQVLSKVDKHNYRKYDNYQEDIVIIKGSSSIVDDVKYLYKKEFYKARIEYNEKQVRDDRKINDYFTHISNNAKNDLACEVIIELGDKKYWDTKDDDYRRKMTNVYKKQVEDLENVVPSFKITSAIIHYDETSPHMHIVGVPIKEGNKNGMSKQVGKTAIFTILLLTRYYYSCVYLFCNRKELNFFDISFDMVFLTHIIIFLNEQRDEKIHLFKFSLYQSPQAQDENCCCCSDCHSCC